MNSIRKSANNETHTSIILNNKIASLQDTITILEQKVTNSTKELSKKDQMIVERNHEIDQLIAKLNSNENEFYQAMSGVLQENQELKES